MRGLRHRHLRSTLRRGSRGCLCRAATQGGCSISWLLLLLSLLLSDWQAWRTALAKRSSHRGRSPARKRARVNNTTRRCHLA